MNLVISLCHQQLSPDTLRLFLSLTCPSTFLFLWDWKKGKRSLAVIWNVLIAIWTPVSLRILNWPAVMSQYSELGDLLHLKLISWAPDSLWLCFLASLSVLTSGNVGCYSWDWEPLEMYASEDLDIVLEIQVITMIENACSRDVRRAIGYFVHPLVLTSVLSITLMSPLLCHWDSSSFLLLSSHKPDCWPLHLLPLSLPLLLSSSSHSTLSYLPKARFFRCLLFFIFPLIALLCRIVNTKHIIAPCGPMIS